MQYHIKAADREKRCYISHIFNTKKIVLRFKGKDLTCLESQKCSHELKSPHAIHEQWLSGYTPSGYIQIALQLTTEWPIPLSGLSGSCSIPAVYKWL